MSNNIKKLIEQGKSLFTPSWVQSKIHQIYGVGQLLKNWQTELNLISAKKIQIEVEKLSNQHSPFSRWLLGLPDLNIRLKSLCSSLEQQLISEENRTQEKEAGKLVQKEFPCIEQHLNSKSNFLKSQTIAKPQKDYSYRYMKNAYKNADKSAGQLRGWINFSGPSPSRCYNLARFDKEANIWYGRIKNLEENAPTVTINSAGKPCYSGGPNIALKEVESTKEQLNEYAEHIRHREQERLNRIEAEKRAQERHYYEFTLPMQRR